MSFHTVGSPSLIQLVPRERDGLLCRARWITSPKCDALHAEASFGIALVCVAWTLGFGDEPNIRSYTIGMIKI